MKKGEIYEGIIEKLISPTRICEHRWRKVIVKNGIPGQKFAL